MALVQGLGEGGLNTDQPSFSLPMNIFSDVSNIRFDDGAVQSITGETTYVSLAGGAQYGIHWRTPSTSYNIFLKDGRASKVDNLGNVSSMNSSAMVATNPLYVGGDWQGTLFNGGYAVVINNGKSAPLYCLYGAPVAGSTFQELPGWNYRAGITTTAKVIRALNYSLVAANLTITEGSTVTHAPSTIRISVQAATGSIPQIWQPGLVTDTADEFEISSTSPVLDMLSLRGSMFVYSQDSINVLTIGNTTRVSPYSTSYGIMGTDCVVEFDGNHFVVDNNDIYVHNGAGSIESLADFRVKKYFFGNLNKQATHLVNVIKDSYYKEIWVCYPKGTDSYCSEALIYQYKNKTWTKRVLPKVSYAFTGPSIFNLDWQYAKQVVYMTRTESNQQLVTNDNYLMYDGVGLRPYTSYVEKHKLNAGDTSGSLLVSAVYPVFDICDTLGLEFRVDGQNDYLTTPDLTDPARYTSFIFKANDPSTALSYKIDPRLNGRLVSYRITGKGHWRLSSIALDTKPADRR